MKAAVYQVLKQAWLVMCITSLFLVISCKGQSEEGRQGGQQGNRAQTTAKAAAGEQGLPVRQPKGAGLFYPQNPEELYRVINELLAEGQPLGLPGARAVLVPHAGYEYSGGVAAAAMRELAPGFRRVFILAANHTGEADFSGVSLPDVSGYAIPGAVIPLSPVVDELRMDPFFTSVPAVHNAYMIENELPFLSALAGRAKSPSFTMIPMVLGRLDREAVQKLAAILHHYADGDTVFVFSVDLSHFYSDNKARQLDSATIDAILSRNLDALEKATADGDQVLMTMVTLADLQGWDATLLKYANSGDATGDRERVVGYAGIAFHQPVRFSVEQRKMLLDLARITIAQYLETGKIIEPPAIAGNNAILTIPRGVFVTLKKDGQLRGCIGDLVSSKPLNQGVVTYAIKAATQDPRFPPVTRDELNSLHLSISVLEYPRRMRANDPREYVRMLHPGQDGLIILYKGRSSTYLPQVWEDLPDPVLFLSRLCQKQGAPANCWLEPEAVLFKYSAYEFGEE